MELPQTSTPLPHDTALFENLYRKRWPNVEAITDRVVMASGQTYYGAALYVWPDRVIRTLEFHAPYGSYPNIHIELSGGVDPSAIGWMLASDQTDYIVYAYPWREEAFFFPWHDLRDAWRLHKTQWLKECDVRSIPAPHGTSARILLLPALMLIDAMSAQFTQRMNK